MPTIKFVQHDGTSTEVEAAIGQSVMQAAIDQGIPNILADCGGACACGTCHAYIGAPWSDILPAPNEMEQAMLEVASHPQATSRLTCQIKVTAELDGMVVNLPASQM